MGHCPRVDPQGPGHLGHNLVRPPDDPYRRNRTSTENHGLSVFITVHICDCSPSNAPLDTGPSRSVHKTVVESSLVRLCSMRGGCGVPGNARGFGDPWRRGAG